MEPFSLFDFPNFYTDIGNVSVPCGANAAFSSACNIFHPGGLRYIAASSEFQREVRALKRMYPAHVRELSLHVERILDYYDYPGSFIYDEHPDKTTLLRIADEIKGIAYPDSEEAVPYLVELLLYHEIFLRRQKRRRTP